MLSQVFFDPLFAPKLHVRLVVVSFRFKPGLIESQVFLDKTLPARNRSWEDPCPMWLQCDPLGAPIPTGSYGNAQHYEWNREHHRVRLK
jgi:hypothetical protein